jgi:hypothetical protein
MPQDPMNEKLAKAKTNIDKLCRFFAARQGWRLADDAQSSALELARAAAAVDRRLKGLVTEVGADPAPPERPQVDPAVDGVFDRARLERFTAFLDDLDAWFASHGAPPSSDEGIRLLRNMEATLAANLEIIDALMLPATPSKASASTEFAIGDTPAAAAGASRPVAAPPGAPSASGGPPQQLALDDTEEHPMVQSFQGLKELTPECKELVDGFLAAWDLDYSDIHRRKLRERLVRWIDSAPHGQVLVIRISTMSEPWEPYPSYVARERLVDSEAAQDA